MSKSITEYINALNDMYDKRYGCEHFDECKGNNKFCKFKFDRLKIGEKYGTYYPKVLFCGLESKRDYADKYKGKIIPPISLNDEYSKPSLVETNEHYRGVRYVLSYLFSKIKHEVVPQNATKNELNKELYINHLKHYCLTNIYKCAFSEKVSNLPHSEKMQAECFNIFFDEIEILKPEFVVIQVVTGRPPSLKEKMIKRFGGKNILIASDGRKNNTSVLKLTYKDESPFYCIWTYHGRGFPFTNKKGGIFVNNEEYLRNDLNPTLDKAIEDYLKSKE